MKCSPFFHLRLFTVVLALRCALGVPPVHAVETDCHVRDPSTIVKHGDTYWLFGTGKGTQQFSSTDRLHWTNRGSVFPMAPDWIAGAVPENTRNEVWAPDVRFFNGQYHLYYSYSMMGSKISGIGVATNKTLDPRAWVDQGVVIQSTVRDDFNTIDPCIFEDAEGKTWLAFGSYFSGIKLLSIDPKTGKRQGTQIYTIANRPTTPGNAIEAPCIYFHDGYYYLFVNWDNCCAGGKSAYNIRVGRSKSVTGPYLDKSGKDLKDGGGTLFLAAMWDNGSGRPVDDQVGPGHVGILKDTDGFWLSTHYEWARDKNGATTVNLNKLVWDADGWPRALLDPGPYKIVSHLGTHNIISATGDATADGTPLDLRPFAGGDAQKWRLDYQGEGFYSLINVASQKALSVAGCAVAPGSKMELASFTKRDCQLWYLQQHEDGSYFLLSKNSNKTQALDVPACSLNDGLPLHQWNANGLDCQMWSFRRH